MLMDKQSRSEEFPAQDIWSLGITMIELADGFTPGSRKANRRCNPYFLMASVVNQPAPTLPHSDGAQWTSNFDDFVNRCLQKDPRQRASAKQLAQHPFIRKTCVDLERCGGCSPVLADLVSRAQRWAQEQRANSLSAISLISLMVNHRSSENSFSFGHRLCNCSSEGQQT